MLAAKLRLILDETADKYSRADGRDNEEYFDVAEEVGYDFDAAFVLGVEEGQISFARHLLELLGVLEEQELTDGE